MRPCFTQERHFIHNNSTIIQLTNLLNNKIACFRNFKQVTYQF